MDEQLKVKEFRVDYSPETINKFFIEWRRSELEKVQTVLESFHIDDSIIEAVIVKLKEC